MEQSLFTDKSKADIHSNVPSTSKGIIEQPGATTNLGTSSASFSNISVDDDSSSSSNQATIRNMPTSVDQEEPMNDAYAKKVKHSLKVILRTIFFRSLRL